ncbi:hypothetical protein [uncultured Aquimarina sp.]|uniref:hypothetical protein n=1 Tax=uncultured Aquimarina sp. TaxID=575652 RepID=UPI00260C95B1|nr:hypothetical protein [uncultured Aquimarina sp.]
MKCNDIRIVLFLILNSLLFSSCDKEEIIAIDPNDKVGNLLSTSRENYVNAIDGEWILITKQEYLALASGVQDLNVIGSSNLEYNTTSDIITTTSSPSTLANQTNMAIMPENSYLFAFKYHAVSATNQLGCKVKLSNTSNTEGYFDIGSNLPKHSAINTNVYFLLKRNSVATIDTGYIALFKPAGLTIGRKSSIDEYTYFFELGDTDTITEKTSTPLKLLYQGLSTTTKQW